MASSSVGNYWTPSPPPPPPTPPPLTTTTTTAAQPALRAGNQPGLAQLFKDLKGKEIFFLFSIVFLFRFARAELFSERRLDLLLSGFYLILAVSSTPRVEEFAGTELSLPRAALDRLQGTQVRNTYSFSTTVFVWTVFISLSPLTVTRDLGDYLHCT